MAARPQDMTVAKSEAAADTIASAIHDLAEGMDITSARDASIRRMLRKHARDIVSLHDELDADTVLRTPRAVATENARLVDLGGNVREG
jgi:hypothetical protein